MLAKCCIATLRSTFMLGESMDTRMPVDRLLKRTTISKIFQL